MWISFKGGFTYLSFDSVLLGLISVFFETLVPVFQVCSLGVFGINVSVGEILQEESCFTFLSPDYSTEDFLQSRLFALRNSATDKVSYKIVLLFLSYLSIFSFNNPVFNP